MNISNEDLAVLKSKINNIGFASINNAINAPLFESLCEEASAQYASARRVFDDGVISYRSKLADLGQQANEFLTSRSMTEFLHSVFEHNFVLNTDSSCYTYYNAGDFLTPHMDGAEDCEVTVLVYVDAASPYPDRPDTGLSLKIYENKDGKPNGVRHSIKTWGGMIVVGRGSKEWHGRPPLLDGERVSMVTACFTSVP